MAFRLKRLFFALTLATGVPAGALDANRPLAEFTMESWGRPEGLPHSFVIDLAQSADGYLWAATWQGAVRFNGREFVIFDQTRLPWNRDGSAWALAQGTGGSLLLGSQRHGVSRLSNGRWTQAMPADAMPLPLLALLEDPLGRLWVGTQGGLLRIDGSGERRFGVDTGLPDSAAQTLSATPSGTVWVGTGNGAARIEGDVVTAFGAQQGLPPGEVGMILASADGSVRVGTKQGAYRLAGERFVREPADLPVDQVSSLLLDRQGSLWIGTISNGVYRSGARGLEHIDALQGLPSNHVNALLEDTQGNLWIGTHGGLTQLRETRFALYSKREGLADDFVRAVAPDTDGAVWVATNGGISRIANGQVEALAERHPDAALSSLSILTRSNGETWFGTYSHGVRVLDAGGMRAIGRSDGLAGDEVRSMLEARDGAVWVGTATGLTRLAESGPRSWTRIQDSPRTMYVRALLQDRTGRVWIGLQQGLAWSDGERVAMLEASASDPISVFGLSECTHGALWIVGQSGVQRVRDGKLDRLPASHDLSDTTIFALRADGQGTDWLSTADGLIAINHDHLEQAIDGTSGKLPMVRYADGPGAEGLALNGGSNPAANLAQDKRIWLATSQGVAVFDPAALESPVAPPPTVIERIHVDGTERDPADAARLPAGTRRIQYDYAGLSYLAPESLRYRYRLVGYDAAWIDAGAVTSVGYTNLNPGDYRFEVESLVQGASGPPRQAQHAFHLTPYLYQTLWFRALCILTLVLLAALAYRLRVTGLRRQAQTLRALVEERTQELRARSQSLERADQEKAELIERLSEKSALLARHAQEDGLTGLANRRQLDLSAAAAIHECREQGRPISLALVDIDHFKNINDAHGHATGDDVLRAVARVLAERAPAPRLAGRYGGEEFGIILPDHARDEAVHFCETLRNAIAQLDLRSLAPEVRARVSIGVAEVTTLDLPAAYAAADRQLYAAKRAGRDRVCG